MVIFSPLNADSGIIVTAVIVLGIFTYSFYNNVFNTVHNTSNTIVNKEVEVQTDSLNNTNINLDTISELPTTTTPNIESSPFFVEAGVQTSNNSLWSLFKDWICEKYAGLSGTATDSGVENVTNNLNTSQSTLSQNVKSVESESYFPELVEVNPTGVYDIEVELDLRELILDPTINFTFEEIREGVWEYFVTLPGDIILTVSPKIVDFLLVVEPSLFF